MNRKGILIVAFASVVLMVISSLVTSYFLKSTEESQLVPRAPAMPPALGADTQPQMSQTENVEPSVQTSEQKNRRPDPKWDFKNAKPLKNVPMTPEVQAMNEQMKAVANPGAEARKLHQQAVETKLQEMLATEDSAREVIKKVEDCLDTIKKDQLPAPMGISPEAAAGLKKQWSSQLKQSCMDVGRRAVEAQPGLRREFEARILKHPLNQ